jgi:hypothetical protein
MNLKPRRASDERDVGRVLYAGASRAGNVEDARCNTTRVSWLDRLIMHSPNAILMAA